MGVQITKQQVCITSPESINIKVLATSTACDRRRCLRRSSSSFLRHSIWLHFVIASASAICQQSVYLEVACHWAEWTGRIEYDEPSGIVQQAYGGQLIHQGDQ